MQKSSEHTISQAIIGVLLMIALVLLFPYYCESFMIWVYILVGALIVFAFALGILNLRKNMKIREENEDAMKRNPKRIAILSKLGCGNDIEFTGPLDFPLLRHPKGYNVKWVYDKEWEVAYFTLYVKEKEKAVIEQKYDDWFSTQTPEDVAGFKMIFNLSSFDDTDDDGLLMGVSVLHIGFRARSTMRFGRIEFLLIQLQTLVDSLSLCFVHRQFRLNGLLKDGICLEYQGLTLISATRQTSKGMEDSTAHLPSHDFNRLDDMLTWVKCDDMVYIDSCSIFDV